MKKVLVTSILAASFAGAAFAEESSNLKVTLGGDLNSQFGGVSQKKDYRYETPGDYTSGKLSKYSFVNDTALKLNIDGDVDGLKYGGFIKLKADTSKNKYGDQDGNATQVMGYFESMFGKVEMGSYRGVASAMRVDAGSVAAATGGVRGDSRFWWNKKTFDNDANSLNFVEQPVLLSDMTDAQNLGTKRANAAKISYFTPNFSGFSLGLSYTPDLDKYGTVNNQTKSDSGSYKNVWQLALRYDMQMNDVDFKAYLAGETGKDKESTSEFKYRNLEGVEGGFAVGYMGFNFAGSYGSHMKSGVLKSEAKNYKRSDYWTLGAGYNYSGVGASVTYLETRADPYGMKKTNKLQNVVVGVDYALAPGFMPYAEVSFFNLKDVAAKEANKERNKGQVYLVGTKLSF
jgi:hypothetical protein